MIKKVKLFRFDQFYSGLRSFEKTVIKDFPKLFTKVKKLLKMSENGTLDFRQVL